MTPTLVLINIIGGVCLLLWGLRMVRTGITRAFGANLRKVVSASTGNRFLSFLSGIGVTALLQSSTATAMIIASFASRGLITVAAGLAVMLGADVGTTVVAQLLSFDLSWFAPLLMLTGYIVYTIFEDTGKGQHIGKLLLGLGMMLFALGAIKLASSPLQHSETLPVILKALEADPILSVVVAALLTWMAHSSLAIVLLLVSFVAGGVLPEHLALMMVLGVNLGGTVAPLVATMREGPEAARVPVGNLLMRLIGVVAFMPLMGMLTTNLALPVDDPSRITLLGTDPTRIVVNFHMAFNIILAIAFIPFTGLVAKAAYKLMPDRPAADDPGRPRYLDTKSMDTPTIALASAARETLRMADILEKMMEDTFRSLKGNNEALVNRIKEQDNVVDDIYKSIKSYMARLSQSAMDPDEASRYVQTLTFSTNLEHAGDVIDKNIMPMALKKIRAQKSFSQEGLDEIEHIHNLVLESIRLAQTVFVSGDIRLARKMVEGKEVLRKAEQEAMTAHIERLRDAVPETIATSSMHLDIIRDYRRVNSYMCTVAYPLLEQKGQLRTSRLRPEKDKMAKAQAMVERDQSGAGEGDLDNPNRAVEWGI
ncbi:Na/Pi cotransporter family protein [Micavibrio aeruginosavorus]|uniref:Sodium-dependent phosphate transporter n=1 Tax=Micavibrio aeruginosavorus EPB TaxID=349215 RepID=M4VIS8_9BACT|nr:Na/Pi cotransporter family protein [Micavibrio aeruginosavorus]AGH98395.1 Sodium-dependent phosphate transporter [Micavibrio aeruginosavorus EPB]